MEIFIKLIMAILGMALYFALKTRVQIANGSFSLERLVNENIKSWIWSVIVIAIILTIISIEPKSTEIIKSLTGWDVDASIGGFLVLGVIVSGSTRNAEK